MATLADRLEREWEVHHPALLSAVALGAILVAGPKIFALAKEEGWKLDQLYTCVFTISTVFTAFLFTFYTFVVTAERGFLGKAKDSTYFKQTVKYTINAIVVGGIVCVLTVPLLIIQPYPKVLDGWLIFAAVWAGFTVWATASFIRAAYLFAIFAGNQH